MATLYKRNAQGKPQVWKGEQVGNQIIVEYGLVGGNLHKERITITTKTVNELESRVKAKRKEGYKELSELKDGVLTKHGMLLSEYATQETDVKDLIHFLDTYLPKYSTTSEGFILPMLAKLLEDNKPFEKFGAMMGQWKINGLRCIVGAREVRGDFFKPYELTYHSREGEDWTSKMFWMDEILLPKISKELLSMMIEEGAYLDGELYLPGYKVNDINSFVKNSGLPQHYQLQYWCYDLCYENMSAYDRSNLLLNKIDTFITLFTKKESHLNNKKQFILLPTYNVNNISEAIDVRDDFINRGFEGLILRNPSAEYQFGKRNQSMLKFKKIDDGLFDIVDIKEDKRGLPVYTLRNDINEELFDCTINLPQDKQREQLQMKDYLIGKQAFVEYRERSGKTEVPFHAKIIKIYV